MVQHLNSYLSEADALNVLDGQRKTIAKEIHSQMMAHFFEEATDFEGQVRLRAISEKPWRMWGASRRCCSVVS